MLAKQMGHYEKKSCFSVEILVEIDYALNFDLPPIFDNYDEPLVYKGEEHSDFDINSSVDFSQPPIFDNFEDDKSCDANAQGSFYSFTSDHGFEIFAKPIRNTFNANEFQICQDKYLIEFRMVEFQVHGGRRGGRHKLLWHKDKDLLQSNEMDMMHMMQPCRDDRFKLAIWIRHLFVVVLLFIFDPGGFQRSKNRADSF